MPGSATTGGAGGRGGGGSGAGAGGGGGTGGWGAVVTGAATGVVGGAVTGGQGGSGGEGGQAGAGGAGLYFSSTGASATIGSAVTGGQGGAGGAGSSSSGAAGAGGVGIVGQGLSLVLGATVSGGLTGDGVTRADAISFTGGANRIEIGSGGEVVGNVGVVGSLEFAQPTNAALASAITGSGSISKSGAGVLTLTGANTYAGTTTISAGTLQIGDGGSTGSLGAGAVVNNGSLVFQRDSSPTIANAISGSGSVTILRTAALGGANSYTGGTVIKSFLYVASDGALGDAAGSLTFDNGFLDSTSTFTSSRPITLNSGGGVFEPSSGTTLTLTGLISGAGGLGNNGPGTLVLTGANTYTGATVLGGGVIRIASDAAFGDSSRLYVNGGTLQTTADVSMSRPVELQNRGGSFAPDANTLLTLSGVVSGSSYSLTNEGAGKLVLTGANTYGATVISSGALQIGNGGTTGTLGAGAVANSGALIFNRSNALTASNAISGAGGLEQAGPGSTILTGANTYSGGTTIRAGTLQIGDGGTTGSITGAVANSGTLIFKRSNDITASNLISGTGGLIQDGAGTLILTAANTYGGTTSVDAGTLLIDGDQTGATGAYDVAVGGTLGGAGVVGGDLTIDGALAPGSAASAGTLTVKGNLILNQTAQLDYQLGAAGTAGGALNDLIVVDGALTLDGVLNVTQTTGGVFGPGLYRLIDYTGALIDNQLVASSGTVQTSTSGQVNLYVTAPPAPEPGTPPVPPAPPSAHNFWSGGEGTWRAAGGGWGDSSGTSSGDFTPASFAIFSGAPGTVTVDNSDGAVRASGLQFASNGYRIVGGPLTLVGGQPVIRVGDGTSAGAGFVGTIGADLVGDGRLEKADGGVLILTGAARFAQGTLVSGGTLQLGDGGQTGSIAGDVQNDARLVFNRANGMTFDGVISGGGLLQQVGAGMTTLSGDSGAFAGRTEILRGTLAAHGRLGGQVEVFDGGRLIGRGEVGSLVNHAGGVVAPGASIGTLTVAGDYVGAGGKLEIEANLGGDGSPADRLVVRGATSGVTLVDLVNLGGTGGLTSEGVAVVEVGGASNGVFRLSRGDFQVGGENAIVGGAFGYLLRKDAEGGDWRLHSTLPGGAALYQPAAPVYEAYPQALRAINTLGSMRERGEAHGASNASGVTVWGRVEGGRLKVEPSVSSTGASSDTDRWKVQFGVTRALGEDVFGGGLSGALIGHYAEGRTRVASTSGGGVIDARGYGVGGALTWNATGGTYLDAQSQASWFESDLSSNLRGARAEDLGATGYAASLEVGRALKGSRALVLTPQAQVTYASIDFDSFDDPFGAGVSGSRTDSLVARVGLGVDYDWAATKAGAAGRIFGLVDVEHEFLDGSRVDVGGANLSNRPQRSWAGFVAGASYGWGAGRYLVYGQASADTALSDLGDSYAASGSAGFRMTF